MNTDTVLASTISLVFLGLALWHVRMAVSPSSGESGAVPSVAGQPLFVPSVRATLLVAALLLLFACLVAARAGFLQVGIPQRILSWLCYALALGLLARAVGDFKYVGFFKRVRAGKFARLDTLVYSPLCLLLSIGVALVAWQHGSDHATWLASKIAGFERSAPSSPPRAILRTTYQDKTAYYVTPACCDIPSELYDEQGALLCFPDGGFAGGDGKCPGFALAGNPREVWRDARPAPFGRPAASSAK